MTACLTLLSLIAPLFLLFCLANLALFYDQSKLFIRLKTNL